MNLLRQDPAEVTAGGIKWRRHAAEWLTSHAWARWLEPLFIFVGGIGVGIWLLPLIPQAPTTDAIFQQAHTMYAGRLGKPTAEAMHVTLRDKQGHGVIQGLFDSAWLVWLDNPGKLYAIPLEDNGRKFVDKDDTFSMDTTWAYSSAETRKRPSFKGMPTTCLLPAGGFAVSWDKQPNEWKWAGCGKWYCELHGENVLFQDFENGRMIGPMRFGYGDVGSQIFILFKDGSHSSVRSDQASPQIWNCIP
ncbi:hypothetical protein GGD63_001427 [Bradyrhizobium sp. cir1]|uniref:hypothetical protein n=1 Tax=Bradyrhizobium sp. cir1 TaxID=1445730 RepID=UPI0016061CBD|nr:hypothetical protein [Bradyrhizobium sp. cir1]MBB4368648.1 hypothetical protein [Bradyrhizobium sp. cir1]